MSLTIPILVSPSFNIGIASIRYYITANVTGTIQHFCINVIVVVIHSYFFFVVAWFLRTSSDESDLLSALWTKRDVDPPVKPMVFSMLIGTASIVVYGLCICKVKRVKVELAQNHTQKALLIFKAVKQIKIRSNLLASVNLFLFFFFWWMTKETMSKNCKTETLFTFFSAFSCVLSSEKVPLSVALDFL